MSDDELERRLRAYRPAAPPPALRQRVLAASGRRAGTIREWLPAVAAALMASFFYWLAATERQSLDARFPALTLIDQQAIEMERPQ